MEKHEFPTTDITLNFGLSAVIPAPLQRMTPITTTYISMSTKIPLKVQPHYIRSAKIEQSYRKCSSLPSDKSNKTMSYFKDTYA